MDRDIHINRGTELKIILRKIKGQRNRVLIKREIVM